MKPIRLLESDCGGLAHIAFGPLRLYGFQPEVICITERLQLQLLCANPPTDDTLTFLILGRGFLNQLGDDVIDVVPSSNGQLQVICYDNIDVPAESKSWLTAATEDELIRQVLKCVGETPDRLRSIEASINAVLTPRFDEAVLTYGEYFCYDEENDIELHLPVDEVRDHFLADDLQSWLRSIVISADEKYG